MKRATRPDRARTARRARLVACAFAGGLIAGTAAAGLRALDEAARPAPDHPDFLAWEVCAGYIPRWFLPYMRECVAAASPESAAESGGNRLLMCGFP